jgi:hypothetical protein
VANQLINSVAGTESATFMPTNQEKSMNQRKEAPVERCFLYSLAYPAGKIFTGAEAIEKALEGEWKDTPPPAELLAQTAQADADTGSALQELIEANQALVKELETATSELQAANQRADDAEAKLVEAEKQLAAPEHKIAAAVKGSKDASK